MTRTAAREIAVRLSYCIALNPEMPEQLVSELLDEEYYATLAAEDSAFEEYPDDVQKEYITRLLNGVALHGAELDGYIEKYAKGWKFARISQTALAIMRTAMYEIMYMPDIPDGAAINEAVELAKKYEEEETVPFVNGILGSFVRGEKAGL